MTPMMLWARMFDISPMVSSIRFGSFFMRLDRVAVGDTIVAQSATGRTTFTVVDVSVVPVDQLDLSADSSDRVLLLFAGSTSNQLQRLR